MNKEKLYKQIKTMNKEQLLDLCKSTTSIIDDLQDRIDKVLDFINVWKDNKTELKVSMLDLLQIEDIVRGEDNEYKIEIWKFHQIIDTYENDDIEEIIKWYREHWKLTYDNGYCAIYIYKNGVRLSFDEEYKLGIFEDYDEEVEDVKD